MNEKKEKSGSLESCNDSKTVIRKMYVAAVAALSFAIAMGMACGYSASATADMSRQNSPIKPDEGEKAWIGSILALGALLGGLIAGFMSNKFGRKGSLILTSIPFMIGWLFIAYADKLVYVYVGRFVTGVSVGIICVTTPPYLIEISTPEIRGLLGSSFQLFVVIGVLIINGLGAVLHWEWLTIPAAGFVIFAVVVMIFMPESPRWLITKGEYDKAIKAIRFLQGDFLDASAECVAIDEDLRSQSTEAHSMKDLRKPEVVIPALLSFSLVFFQQTTGSNAVLFYTVDIFKTAGNFVDGNTATVIIDSVLVGATALSSLLVDKTGRKILLISSGLGMAVSLIALGVYDYFSMHTPSLRTDYGWVPLCTLVIYVSAFSIGFGPIPWLMMAEITPIRSRSLICSIATAVCWFFVFVITKTFQTLEITIHDYGAYFLYASFALLSCIFTYFCLPETKGKPTEDIQQQFSNYFKHETLVDKVRNDPERPKY